MKKRKIILMLIVLLGSVSLITGCSKKDDNKDNSQTNNKKTVATALVSQFEEEIKKEQDLEKVAQKLAKNSAIKISTDVTVLGKEEYLSGFSTEIKGFDKAVAIKPIIGSIPFIAYLFEVENADEFENTLKDNADLRWNICTEADELETSKVNNYVFFVMAPKNFDEE